VKTLTSQLIFQAGQVEIDLGRRELRVQGAPVPIGGRAFEVIETLAHAAGELVTTDQLMERVWPNVIVEENTLQVHISAARKALGPDRGMLRNLKGRGYRLIGAWHVSEGTTPVNAIAVAAPSSSPASHNLPAAATDLIGRGAAVQELQDLLSAHRVITLTGPGGIGKTRLALEAAHHMAAQGSGDVWLVELASLSDPGLLASVVASTLHLGLGYGEVSAEAVARAIGQRKILLLLDNCEHIIDAAAMLAETMIRHCPQATILATSREVLRIDGEHVYRVPPLDVPDQQDVPGNILNYGARAIVRREDFRLGPRILAERNDSSRYRGHLPTSGRHPSRHRVRGGPGGDARRAPGRDGSGQSSQPTHGWTTHGTRSPSDTPRSARLEL